MPLRIFDDPALAREQVLRRRLPDAASIPDSVRARLNEVLGADLNLEAAVREIIRQVRVDGDAALRRFSAAFDGRAGEILEVAPAELDRAWKSLPDAAQDALELAAARIRRFHERAMPRSWLDFEGGSTFGQVFRPIARVGVYAPGGRAVYPSTVLMTAIPARVAGVETISLCSPPGPNGLPHPSILAAARVAGVDHVYQVGGAQAIAALAYGTESVHPVDKIVGPGNVFVALAKREVFGVVGIDQIAGPTETLIIADDGASPAALAADLLAQAEHDPMATALLITSDRALALATAQEIDRQIGALPRQQIIADSLAANGAAIVVSTLDLAVDLANDFAPEHLCLSVRDPWRYLPRIRNAGGVFLGERSIEAIGDYTAGPSHVMPTGGTARFASTLNVLDFLKVSSVFDVSAALFDEIATATVTLAETEGLAGHAAAVRLRQGGENHGQSEL